MYRSVVFVNSLYSTIDLFDEEGFSLSELNEHVVGSDSNKQNMFFVNVDGDYWDELANGQEQCKLNFEKKSTLQRARVCTYLV